MNERMLGEVGFVATVTRPSVLVALTIPISLCLGCIDTCRFVFDREAVAMSSVLVEILVFWVDDAVVVPLESPVDNVRDIVL